MGRQKKWTVSSVNNLLRKIVPIRPLQVIVWSRAASTSVKAWWRPSQYPKLARYQLINFIDNKWQRNQGRCKLRRNSAAAMSSPGDSSEVLRSFRVSNFQQDGAPSYRAKSTVEFLQCTVPNFIEPSVWPPNTPDLNLIDYAVWGALQQSVYRIPISNLYDLKDSAHLLGESWPTDHQVQWSVAWQTKGSSSLVRVNGGHSEQLLWISGSFDVTLCCVA